MSFYRALSSSAFRSFAGSATQLEQNTLSSNDTLREIHHRYVIASAADAALTADSFSAIDPAEGGLGAHLHAREDVVRILSNYANLLAALSESAPDAKVQAIAHDIRSDAKVWAGGAELAPATNADGIAWAAESSPFQSGDPAVAALGSGKKLYSVLDQVDGAAIHMPGPTIMKIIAGSMGMITGAAERTTHHETLRSLLSAVPPDLQKLASFLEASNKSMLAVRDAMVTRILARANQVRPAYDTAARLEFDGDLAGLLSRSRALSSLLSSIDTAAAHSVAAHDELAQMAESKETVGAALDHLRDEVMKGLKFCRTAVSERVSAMLHRSHPDR